VAVETKNMNKLCAFLVKNHCKKKIKNSGNQPEFQSSIKKRTVNQTVVCGKIPS